MIFLAFDDLGYHGLDFGMEPNDSTGFEFCAYLMYAEETKENSRYYYDSYGLDINTDLNKVGKTVAEYLNNENNIAAYVPNRGVIEITNLSDFVKD